MRISREIDIGIALAIQPGQMEAAQFVAVARLETRKEKRASRPRNDGVHVDKMPPLRRRANVPISGVVRVTTIAAVQARTAAAVVKV